MKKKKTPHQPPRAATPHHHAPASQSSNAPQEAGLRRRAEEVAREKSAQFPESRENLSLAETRKTLHEMRVHQIELEMQNEELRRTQLELAAARARYFDLYELAPVGYCTISQKGLILEANFMASALLGAARGALVRRLLSRFILPADQDIFSRCRQQLDEAGAPQSCKLRMVKMDGTIFWAHLAVTAAQDADGAPVCRVVLSDITEHIRSEAVLAEAAENKFKLIYDNAGDGIALVDPENKKFYTINKTLCRMLGYGAEEIHGLGVLDIHPAQDLPYVLKQFAAQASGDFNLAKDMPVKRKDGSVFYADINSTIIVIAGKKYLAGFFHDITERKRAEADLALAHHQLKQLIDSASQVSIIATDCSGTILTFNLGSERMLGYSSKEMVGKQTPATIHLESEMKTRGQELTKELGHAVEGFEVFVAYAKLGKYDEREWTYVKKDGKHIAVDLIVTAVKDDSGTIVGFLGIAIDITDRKIALQAQAASAAKSQFVANISHEIRTPLNGIIGICELLLETKMSSEQLEYAQIIDSSAETLLNIINATLDFSKIEAGKMELEHVDFDLRDMVEDIVSVLAINASKKKLELICFIEPAVPLDLHGDPNRLRQILFNLVGNAIKFTYTGEIAVNVALAEEDEKCSGSGPRGARGEVQGLPCVAPGSVRRNGGSGIGAGQPERRALSAELSSSVRLCFTVRDTGIGIPADKIKIIFDSFTQADASLARKFGGTGLGLAIARGLVEQMGGTIGVESDHGKGSVFRFTLPFERQQHEAASSEPHDNFGGASMLVVDDNETNRMVLARQLQSWEISVETAVCGAEALARMRSAAHQKKPFVAAIVDQCMPEMDGIALGQAIKADAELKHTVLILMSSITLLPEIFAQNKNLFSAMILKPIRLKHLFFSLLTALKGNKMSAPELKWAAAFQKHEQYQIGNRLHILVAEDNMANQEVTLSILKKMGHVANAVASGREAVKALETVPYDLVLMDVQMPEMDGLEATALIRDPQSQVLDHAIPILALTAHAMGAYREKCLAAGMNGYITKPVSIKAVADAIVSIASAGNALAPKDKPDAADDPAAVFDARAFSSRLRGKSASISKIINITLDEAQKLMRELEQAVKTRHQDTAGRLAHNIRGGAANVSANQFLAVAVKLETACKAGDWRAAENLWPELNRQFAILEREMRAFQKTLI